MSTPTTPDEPPSPRRSDRASDRSVRTPAAQRAEQFLARVLPGLDDEPDAPGDQRRRPRVSGVDDVTQARLEAMVGPDRESW